MSPIGGPQAINVEPHPRLLSVLGDIEFAPCSRILPRVHRPAKGGRAQGNHPRQAAALEYLPDARGGHRRRCGRCLAWPHRTHDTGGLRAGHRRPPDRCVGGVLGKRGRTNLGQMAFTPPTSANDGTRSDTNSKRFSPGGAKGTRTPDPHTASVVRYQLRHSPRRRAHRSYTTARQPSKSLVTPGPEH
jgi:hypothetical protein